MAQPSRPDETGHVPIWLIALLGIAWATIVAGLALYVGGVELVSP